MPGVSTRKHTYLPGSDLISVITPPIPFPLAPVTYPKHLLNQCSTTNDEKQIDDFNSKQTQNALQKWQQL